MTLPRRASIWLFLGLLTLRDRTSAQKADGLFPPQEAVDDGLSTLRGMVSERNYRNMGFDSVEQAQKAVRGDPFPVYYVRLDALRQYDGTSDANALILTMSQVIYPVVYGGEARSSFVLDYRNRKWQASAFGAPARTRSLEAARRKIDGAGPVFIVEIPALHISFVALRTDGQAPGDPHPGGTLRMYEVGRQTVPAPPGSSAQTVLSLLVPRARQLENKP